MARWHSEMTWRWWFALGAAALVTNLVWENAHGVLYDHLIPGWRVLRAAGGDVLFVGAGVGLAWPLRRVSGRAHAVGAALLLTVIAIGIETVALAEGRWGYVDAMPTIGGIGVSPLVQLAVTGVGSIWFAAWCTQRLGQTPDGVAPDVVTTREVTAENSTSMHEKARTR